MKKFLSVFLILTFGILTSTCVFAADEDVVLTITPNITSAKVSDEEIKVMYIIQITPKAGIEVGNFAFTFKVPENMMLATRQIDTKGGENGFWLNRSELSYDSLDRPDALFGICEYTTKSKYFCASNSDAERGYIANRTYDVMTIEATIAAGKSGNFTLGAAFDAGNTLGIDYSSVRVDTTPVTILKASIKSTFKKVEDVIEKTWKNPFTDVTVDNWYYEAVKFVNENKIFNGISDTEFGANVNMTRGMLVTVLYRLAGEPTINQSIPFADVDMSMYYANAISWAKQNNIVNGVNENNFAPDAQVTREQLTTILYRYAKATGKDVSTKGSQNVSSYDDANQISEYAKAAIEWAVESGIFTGRTKSTLEPLGTGTRAEVATMLMRFVTKK